MAPEVEREELAAAELAGLHERLAALEREIGKAIVGQREAVRQLLVALLAGGHALLEGVPGLAKTLMVRSLGRALDLSFKRVQFTPDLMPSDIVGTEILEEEPGSGERRFRFRRGPVFAHLVLADEINRSPPKTQAALLEAMQEYEVTYAGQTYPLERPFFVLATQNPIEQTGTYPLPEAQLDRFMLQLKLEYPAKDEEVAILERTTGPGEPEVEPVMSGDDLLGAQRLTREVHAAPALVEWVAELVRATRPDGSPVAAVRELVEWGAGPRAGQSLLLAAKGRALLEGRLAVTVEDLEALLRPALRHRVLLNFKGQAEGRSLDELLGEVLARVGRPRSPLA